MFSLLPRNLPREATEKRQKHNRLFCWPRYKSTNFRILWCSLDATFGDGCWEQPCNLLFHKCREYLVYLICCRLLNMNCDSWRYFWSKFRSKNRGSCTCYFCCRLLNKSCNACIQFKVSMGPPLWSSGQSFWLQIQRSRVRFPALPDFLSSSGSRTGSAQPREVNWGATWIKSSGSGPENRD